MILLMRGLPGSGKSTIAEAVAQCINAVILNKDYVRAALFPGNTTEYTTSQDDFVIQSMLEAAAWHLDRNRTVIIDGRTHSRAAHVDLVRHFAARRNASCLVIECQCCPETALRRIQADLATGAHPAKNRNEALLADQIAKWESIDGWVCRVDGEGPIEEAVESIIKECCN